MLKRNRFFNIVPACLGLCFCASNLSLAQSDVGLQPVTSARIAGDSRIEAMESGHRAIYFCAPNDVTNWSVFWLPQRIHFSQLEGGSKDGLFVMANYDTDESGDSDVIFQDNAFQFLSFDGTLKQFATGLPLQSEFFDEKIGCQATKKKLLVTLDGGRKWRKMPIDLTPTDDSTASRVITGLRWLSSSELLVGKDHEVILLKVDEKGGKVQWTANVASSPSSFSPEGENAVWLLTSAGDIVLFSRKDGHQITRVRTGLDGDPGSLASNASTVYTWGDKQPEGKTPDEVIRSSTQPSRSILSIWNWDGNNLKLQQTILTDPITGVLPLSAKTDVIYKYGMISTLEGGKLVPQKVRLVEVGHFRGQPDINGVDPTPLPVPPPIRKPLPDDYLPTRDQQMECVRALRSVSASAVTDINQELSDREDLTPRQRCLLIIEKCKAMATTRPNQKAN